MWGYITASFHNFMLLSIPIGALDWSKLHFLETQFALLVISICVNNVIPVCRLQSLLIGKNDCLLQKVAFIIYHRTYKGLVETGIAKTMNIFEIINVGYIDESERSYIIPMKEVPEWDIYEKFSNHIICSCGISHYSRSNLCHGCGEHWNQSA